MKTLNQYTEQNFTIPYECIGEVVNNVDPEDRGRLQVRIYGVIDDSVSNTNCPWCETNGSIISSSKETVGISSAPKVGSFVYVNFLYNNPSFPKVTGYVRGDKDSSLLHTVKGISSVVQARSEIGPELSSLSSSAKYPDNTVIETKSYTIELDDTEGNERVSIQHKSGSYFEIRPDGSIQIKSSKDNYTIVKGNLEEYIEGSVNSIIKGTYNNEANGRTIKSPTTTLIGDLTVTGDVIIGGNSFAMDHISDEISGKLHIHAHGIPNTSTPLP